MSTTPAASVDDESRRFPYWRRNQQVLPAANLLCSLGFGLSWPFLPLMLRGLGVTENLETWIGHMMLVFYIAGFIINPVWGGIADHYGRKIMVLRAMLGMGISMTLVPFAPSPLWFASLVVVIGLFNGFTPAGMALLVANTPPRRVGTAMAFAQTGGLVGQTLGPAAGAVLAALIERQLWLFWISGGLMIAGGLLVFLLVQEVKQRAPGPWRLDWVGSLRELLVVPQLAPLYLLSFMFAALWFGNVTIISVYMLQLLAAHPAGVGNEAFWLGAAAMGLAVSSVVVMPLWGRVLDRYGPERVLTFAAAAAAVTHVPLLLLETPLQLVLARVAFGVTVAPMLLSVIQLLRRYAPKGMDARAISYSSSSQFIGMGLAPFIAGLIGPVMGLRAYFALSIALMLAILIFWLRRSGASGGGTGERR
jgi:MFS transporter, DHA1 family, multidrug resistance protein